MTMIKYVIENFSPPFFFRIISSLSLTSMSKICLINRDRPIGKHVFFFYFFLKLYNFEEICVSL